MTGSRLRLKQLTGWFAAGWEVSHALSLLSDGAFKLFMWICLNADRGLGAIRVDPHEVARVLGKTEGEIRAHLQDLFQAEIVQPMADGAIQIADRYWPYERAPTDQQEEELATFISQLKRAFLERRCVQSAFTTADERIATELFHAGVSITDAEHAILLGSLRKYVALINSGRGTPITSLRYFAALFDEVKHEISRGYWVHVERRVRDAERQWGGFEALGKSDEIKVTK